MAAWPLVAWFLAAWLRDLQVVRGRRLRVRAGSRIYHWFEPFVDELAELVGRDGVEVRR